jgi:hypothetical protein
MKKVLDLRKVNIGALTVKRNPGLEKKLIIGLAILVLGLGVSYGYFVKQTILNVVIRQEIEEKMADLGSHVSSLEVRYIELKNRINLDFAYSLGYRDVPEVKFVSRSTLDKVLTLNSN